MKLSCSVLAAALLFTPQLSMAQKVEEVRGSADAPKLPEDLFALPPGTWAFAKHLWQGDAPCTADQCEAGYTSGDLVVSVDRHNDYIRVVAGFSGCQSVAWNDYEIGKKASDRDSKTIAKRLKKTVGTSAKYCKAHAPAIAVLDARQLFPVVQ